MRNKPVNLTLAVTDVRELKDVIRIRLAIVDQPQSKGDGSGKDRRDDAI
jgi:hypothetical protein